MFIKKTNIIFHKAEWPDFVFNLADADASPQPPDRESGQVGQGGRLARKNASRKACLNVRDPEKKAAESGPHYGSTPISAALLRRGDDEVRNLNIYKFGYKCSIVSSMFQ